jgi:mannose-6-phosphate isomerase-like protein (cupin superfamily)
VSEPVLVPYGTGEIVGDAPERRVEILCEHDTLHATWARIGPHHEGAGLHVHHHHIDLFYVLEGELSVMLGMEAQDAVVPAGTLARVPPLVVHGFRNGSDADVRYLNFHAPGQRFADFLRALRDGRAFSWDQHPPPEDGGRPTTEAVVGGGEVVADRAGLRVRLLADIEEIAIAETSSDPGATPPPQHVHRNHLESFYVLEGELTFSAGNRELQADQGTWLHVPPGVPHAFALTGDRPVRFLDIHTPSSGFGTSLRGQRSSAIDEFPARDPSLGTNPHLQGGTDGH